MRLSGLLVCLIIAACTTIPTPPPVIAAPDVLDMFGGWTGLKSASPKSLSGNSSDSCGPLILKDTGAFIGKNYSYKTLRPDVNDWMFFVIKANNDNQLFVFPSDRLGVEVTTNGNMEADSDWYDYGTPTTNERSTTQKLPWDTYSRHIEGDGAGDGIVQTGVQFDRLDTDCSTAHEYLWNGAYLTYGYVWIVSGQPALQQVESDGTTVEVSENIGNSAVTGEWQSFMTGRSETFSNPTFTAVTIDSGTDTISSATLPDNNDEVVFRATTMPTNLSTCSPYFVINSGGGTFQISTTRGGSAFDFSDTGTSVVWGGTGEIRFVCSGGPCEFYLDDVKVAEYEYDNYVYNFPNLNTMVHSDVTSTVNSGTDEYMILKGWDVEYFQTIKRWGISDPLDNFFIIKGLNNYDFALAIGRDFDGHSWATSWNNHPRVSGMTSGSSSFAYSQGFRDIGFNTIVANITAFETNPGWQPHQYGAWSYIKQTRVQSWNFPDVGELNFLTLDTNHVMDLKWPDVFDADWEGKFANYIASNSIYYPPGGWGIYWNSGVGRQVTAINTSTFQITPYIDGSLAAIANPYLMGWDTDEEPAGIGSYSHMGYMIFTSAPQGSTSSDGISDSKIFALNYLRGIYSEGGETEFVSNISEDGSNMITAYTSWSSVPGYVSSAKDTAALTRLNTAWNTTYSTWGQVYYEDGDDSADTRSSGQDVDADFELRVGCNYGGTCSWADGTATTAIRQDLDEIHTAYGRRWNKYFYEYVFNENTGRLRGSKINFGPGFGLFYGWKHGLKSKDLTTTYVDVFTTGSWGGETGTYEDSTPTLSNRVNSWHTFLGVPAFIETGWLSVEPDSMLGFRNPDSTSRTIDAVYKRNDTNNGVYLSNRGSKGWDCDTASYANIGNYCSETVSTYKFAEDETVYWNCTDPLNSATCTNSGTLFWQFIKATDSPHTSSYFNNKFIIISNAASIGTLTTNDVVTNGVDKMFTVSNNETPCTPNYTTDTFTRNTHGLGNGATVTISGTPPAEISRHGIYYVVNATTNTFKISATLGGAAVDFSDNGSNVTFTTPTYRASMIVDNGANFNTNYNNPNALDATYAMYTLVNEDDPSPRRYYHLAHGFATERSLICWKEASAGTPSGWLGPTGNAFVGFRDVNVGDHYHLNHIGQDYAPWRPIHYETLTNESGAEMWVYLWQRQFSDLFTDSNGDQILIGNTHFGPIDYGFSANGNGDFMGWQGSEIRAWGFISLEGNWYGPDPTVETPTVLIEATRLGKDGTASTADDEEGDYGDKITAIKNYFSTFYQGLMPANLYNPQSRKVILDGGVRLKGVILK